ncbi:carbonyl reductase family member 4-like [Amphiura filiformis]|uniref:carbonyl reductase family member 4-like n=1 Tax=Amphiura filiformis TaxID=82378 RepID=UPI003B2250C7
MACVVYGGSRGIGKAIASAFLQDGFRVAIVARNVQHLEDTISELHEFTHTEDQLLRFSCDITKEQDVIKTSEHIHHTVGAVSILVNSAGINQDSLLIKSKSTNIEDLIQTNLVGPMITCRTFLRGMMQRKDGCIINIGSIVGQRGNAGQTAYSASKAGLVGFTKSLAKEVKDRGIRVNLIAPGFIDTDMTKGIIKRQELEKAIPLGRFGMASEVADAALFLAKSCYITGHVLNVDGGLNLNI